MCKKDPCICQKNVFISERNVFLKKRDTFIYKRALFMCQKGFIRFNRMYSFRNDGFIPTRCNHFSKMDSFQNDWWLAETGYQKSPVSIWKRHQYIQKSHMYTQQSPMYMEKKCVHFKKMYSFMITSFWNTHDWWPAVPGIQTRPIST